MRHYLDASALVSLVFAEGRLGTFVDLMFRQKARLLMSDFGRAEFASAVSMRVRQGTLAPSEAAELLAWFDDWQPTAIRLVPVRRGDVREATRLVERFELKLRAPDALHVAVARRLDASLVTFDLRQAAAATALGLVVVGPEAEPVLPG